jgi:hypothetical protein
VKSRASVCELSCASAMATFNGTAVLASNIAVRRRGRRVLQDASFEIPDRAIAGILVADHAATSAIFRVLCGRSRPHGGRVTVGEWVSLPCSSFWRRGLDRLRSMPRSRPPVVQYRADMSVDTEARLPRVVLIDAKAQTPAGCRGQRFAGVAHRLQARGLTVVMAAQRLELLASCCDWLIVVDAKNVTYAGTTHAFRVERPSIPYASFFA